MIIDIDIASVDGSAAVEKKEKVEESIFHGTKERFRQISARDPSRDASMRRKIESACFRARADRETPCLVVNFIDVGIVFTRSKRHLRISVTARGISSSITFIARQNSFLRATVRARRHIRRVFRAISCAHHEGQKGANESSSLSYFHAHRLAGSWKFPRSWHAEPTYTHTHIHTYIRTQSAAKCRAGRGKI